MDGRRSSDLKWPLPTGTVTFLFTDVASSTRLLREHGAAYADLLGEHRRALRAAFEQANGVEVDTQGDAFLPCSRASDAVAAAANAKAALADGPVQVRIGIHTGEPFVTDEGHRASTSTARPGSRQPLMEGRS